MRDLPLVGEEFAGYRLLSVLGRGGMSTVYRAQNPRLGNVIALKVLAPELAGNEIFRARFLEESVIAASLNHPNVVPIHDSGSSDGLLYIAMRCVSGISLRQLLGQRGRLRPETAVFLLSQAARALDAAHRGGLVHRDVKPGNLLIEQASDGSDPDHLYLTDFGIAKRAADCTGLNATGQVTGTVDYISPEQVRGLPVLGPADQYSLGCVLYECLTGRVPFERDENAVAAEERPPRATALRPGLPRAVDEVFARVLAQRPEDRYGSCREFMAAAHDAIGSPAEPAPGTPPRAGLGHLEEIAHEREAVPVAADGVPGPAGPAWRDQRDWPGAGVDETRADRGRGRRRGPVLRAAGVAAALVLVGGIGVAVARSEGGATTQVTLSGKGTGLSVKAPRASHSPGPGATRSAAASPSASASTNMGMQVGDGMSGPATLAGVLGAANSSVEGRGLLDPAKCGQYRQNANGAIVCTSPVPGVAQVYYQNYSSLPALYNAYKTQITELSGKTFRENTHTCGNSAVSYAEFGWNMEEGHPHNFTVAQMAAGRVGQIFALGRMACFATRTPRGVSQDIVWTVDNGPAMGVAIGSGSPRAVYQLWASLHHPVMFRGTEMCGTAGRMNMHDIPTGNLKVLPVCPPGVQAVPASSPGR